MRNLMSETDNSQLNQAATTTAHRWAVTRALAGGLLSMAIFVLAIWFLHRELAALDFSQVLTRMHAMPIGRLAIAALLAAGSYGVLTGYDSLAVRYVGKSISYAKTAMVAFMAFAVGHNIGLAALSGGSIRYRVYGGLGLSGLDIASVIIFCTLTFSLGASLLLGASLWLMPIAELSLLNLPNTLLKVVGSVLLMLPAAYLLASKLHPTALQFSNWSIRLPRPPTAAAQLLLGVADLCFAAGTLYVLLAPDIPISFPAFLGIYLLAMAAGLLSSVPGGVGVFETVVLLALPGVEHETLLGAILVYRIIYYLIPLGLAAALLAGHEASRQRSSLRKAGDLATDWLRRVTPTAMTTLVFLCGVVLLISGSLPALSDRLSMVTKLLPLPVLELSHLLGSLFGVALLLVARSLLRRLHSAYLVTMGLLIAGIMVSLAKGLDYEEALILLAVLAILWTGRKAFYREGSLLEQGLTGPWVATIALALTGSVWIGLFTHRHLEYANQLWWQFSLNGNAPRMLRGALLAVSAAVVFALWKLLRPVPPVSAANDRTDMDAVRRILATARDPSANAALTGDKRFLFNAERSGAIMYQVQGRSWIALGDPLGPASEHEALVLDFRNLCDRFDGRPAFYQVSDESLSLYVDMGLSLIKLGEDASVPLADFSLAGNSRADLRQARNRALRSGVTFRIVPRAEVAALIPALKAVSDEWLAEKSSAEKGFSLGAFGSEYLANFDCAIATRGKEIVAFANLWPAPASGELSVDLMRHSRQAPKGIMDFLFSEILLWARQQGYSRFSLGMAPLSGLDKDALAPLWHKIGNLIYQHGEHFYNFEGLRSYKEKFAPVWKPRYLACPGGLAQARVLVDASLLIAGGASAILRRQT